MIKILFLVPDFNKDSDHIPVHLFGTMNANSWSRLYEDTKPFKNILDVNVSNLNNTKRMYMLTKSFYSTIGRDLNSLRLDESILELPADKSKNVICEPAEYGLKEKQLTKFCAEINFHDYTQIHYMIGRAAYMSEYKDMPITLQQEAYPGLAHAIGGLTTLAMTTPDKLKWVCSQYYQ